MFNQVRPGLPNLLANPLLRFGFNAQPLLAPQLYQPLLNPMSMIPRVGESAPVINEMPPKSAAENQPELSTKPTSSPPSRKRSRTSSTESEKSVSPPKISRIESTTAENDTSDSSSSEVTEAEISANKLDDTVNSDEIKVLRNGVEIDIQKCEICKCIFLDDVSKNLEFGYIVFRKYTQFTWVHMFNKQC